MNLSAPLLAVEGLTKRFGKKDAVSNLCFNVRQAELVGFLGPNGAGKSTTLRMIAGSLAPTAGKVTITGYDITEQPGSAKSQIGYLPEVPPLYPQMTVREYLRFACDLKNSGSKDSNVNKVDNGNPVDESWVKSLVSDLGIEKVMPVLICNLSKGYRQRVGIAAAIAGKPALLLLDEPVSGLDPRQARDFRCMLKRICPEMAIVISSHSLAEVEALCTRIIIMNEGRIAADGDPKELAGGTNLEDLFISLTSTETPTEREARGFPSGE